MKKFFVKSLGIVALIFMSSIAVNAQEFADGVTEFEAPVSTLEVVWPGQTVEINTDLYPTSQIQVSVVIKGESVDFKDLKAGANSDGDGVIINLLQELTEAGDYTLTINRRTLLIDGDLLSAAVSLDFTVTEAGASTPTLPEGPQFAGGVTEFEAPVSTLEVVWPGQAVEVNTDLYPTSQIQVSVVIKGESADFKDLKASANSDGDGVILNLLQELTEAGDYTLTINRRTLLIDGDLLSAAVSLDFTVSEGSSDPGTEPTPPPTPAEQNAYIVNAGDLAAPLSSIELSGGEDAVVECADAEEMMMYLLMGVTVTGDDGYTNVTNVTNISVSDDGYLVLTFGDELQEGMYNLTMDETSYITISGDDMQKVELSFNVAAGTSDVPDVPVIPSEPAEAEFANGVTEFEAPVESLEVVWPGATVEINTELYPDGKIMASVLPAGETVDYKDMAVMVNEEGDGVIITLLQEVTEAGEYTLSINRRSLLIDGELSPVVNLDFTVTEATSDPGTDPEPTPTEQNAYIVNAGDLAAPVASIELSWGEDAVVECADAEEMMIYLLTGVTITEGDEFTQVTNVSSVSVSEDGYLVITFGEELEEGLYTLVMEETSLITIDGEDMQKVNLTFKVAAGESTGISSINGEAGSVIYNLNGMPVDRNNLVKGGIYIINGKKVAVK